MKLKEKTDVNKNFTKLTHKRGISYEIKGKNRCK
ncbi:unknown [Clostridium sp. CAG:465]|nr:unknown [Clostridium sp. CAG:465]